MNDQGTEPAKCMHCGKSISQCAFGCWHHDGERESIFCGTSYGLRFAEPAKAATP